ncbi:ROK family protein [Acrocarpospora catenulata]|uniref:ROK family protein n=1 Tax=Acrocarpospora catenulata TaxID=2836182 RepID=UPI001BDB31E1|nr:ROK family protein [Acrocarpospora catenulata]
MTVLAIDIGGTKFAAAMVEPTGVITARLELPVGGDAAGTLTELVSRIAVPGLTGESGLTGVGIGSAGPLDVPAGTVSPVNIPSWREFPLVKTVGTLLPGLPVRLAGDAQCMTLGEWWRGAYGAKPHGTLLGIVVSTGIGGGVVVDGVPYLGPSGNAGHIGHISVDRDGETCPCGAVGCVETVASGPSMVRWALANGWRAAVEPSFWAGRPVDARALAADAKRGIPVARLAFQRAADALGTAILSAAALFDVDNVVIGGGVAAAGPTLLTPLRQAVARQAGMEFLRRLRVDATTLGRDAGLYGAAALVLGDQPS